MAELRLSINTQQAQAASRDFQRILNDIKEAARQLDLMSLNTLGGTIGRLASEAEKLRGSLAGVSTTLASAVNAQTSNLSSVPGQLNAISTSAQTAASSVSNVLRALQQGLTVSPAGMARELGRQQQELLDVLRGRIVSQQALEDAAKQRELQAVQQQQQVLVNVLQGRLQAQQALEKAAYEQEFAMLVAQEQRLANVLQARLQRITPAAAQTNLAPGTLYNQPYQMLAQQTSVPPGTLYNQPLTQGQSFSGMTLSQVLAQAGFAPPATQGWAPAPPGGMLNFQPYTQSQFQNLQQQNQQAQLNQQQWRQQMQQAAGQQPIPLASPWGGGAGTTAMFANLQGPTAQQAAQAAAGGGPAVGAAAGQTASQMQVLAAAFANTKVHKDALDKNMTSMASQSGSLWQMSFALRTLTAYFGALSLRRLMDEGKQLAETLIETGMNLERATALFGLLKEGVQTADEGIALATATSQEFGVALLPAITGLGKMQAAAYGTAVAGAGVNEVFRSVTSAMGAMAADASHVNSTFTAIADTLTRQEMSGRTIRQLSRELPGLKERLAENMGLEDVQHLMVVLDKGTFTVSQFMHALALSFEQIRKGREHINPLTESVNGLWNALFTLQKTILEAGFKTDAVAGIKALTEAVASPAVLAAAKDFAHMFGVVIRDALQVVGWLIRLVADHFVFFTGVFTTLTALVAGTTLIAGILAVARAFMFLAAGAGAAAGPIGITVAALSIAAGLGVAYAASQVAAQHVQDALTKSALDLAGAHAVTGDAVSKANEHQVRWAKDEEKLNEQIKDHVLNITNYHGELELLTSGVRKDSVEFTGLAEANKYLNKQLSEGAQFTQKQIDQFKELAVAAAASAAGVAKMADNQRMLKDLHDEHAKTAALTTLAASGANPGVIAIESRFQDQFATMKEKFDDLIYNERDLAARNRLIESFKEQAMALREASVQAQLYSNRLKAIQDINQGEQNLQLEEDLLTIWKSIDDTTTRYTQAVTPSTASTLANFRPSTVNNASDAVSAYQYQLDRAGMGAYRQDISGNVTMNVSGNVTFANTQGATATGGSYTDLINKYSGAAGLDPRLTQAMILAESNNDPTAVSRKGAGGLMQLMPGTARDLGVHDVYDPAQNIEGGTRYMSQLMDRYHGNIPESLAAYNAGLGRVTPGGGVPQIPETQGYVQRVLKFMRGLGVSTAEAGELPGAPLTSAAFQVSQTPLHMVITIEKSSSGGEPPFVGVPSRALGGSGFDLGDASVTTQGRSRLEALRDQAARRAIGQFNQGVQLTADDVANQTPAFQAVERQRQAVEFQARRGVDIKTIQDQKDYNIALAEEVRQLGVTKVMLGEDARYRDIDARANADLYKMRLLALDPELQARSEQLIETRRGEEKALQDLNGPLQKYKESLLGISDLDVGMQQVGVAAIRNLQDNYFNIKNLQDMVGKEHDRRTQNAQIDAGNAETRRYEAEIAALNKRGTPVSDAQFQAVRQRHEELMALTKDTQASFSGWAAAGFIFKSFFETVLDGLQKMVLEMLIFKPLAAELQAALSGTSATGGFGSVLSGLSGAGAASSGAAAASSTSAAMDAAVAFSQSASAISSGGSITLRGVEHFQGGGTVRTGTDTIPAMLTPGEVVLNKNQQAQLASQSQGNVTYVFSPTVHAQDAESVRKTMPQIQAEFYRSTQRLSKRNNLS